MEVRQLLRSIPLNSQYSTACKKARNVLESCHFQVSTGKDVTMQVGFFNPVSYAGTPTTMAWPVPPALCDREAVNETMRRAKEQLRLADELGFDWVSVSEHHYSP